MAQPEVISLPSSDLEPFLVRRRYEAYVPIRLEVDSFLREIMSKANDFVPSRAGAVLLDLPLERNIDKEKAQLHIVAGFGDAAGGLIGRPISATKGIAGHVYQSGASWMMNDPQSDPYFSAALADDVDYRVNSLLAVPIRIERTVCGVLELINRIHADSFTEKDRELLEIFARYTSVSIENLLDAQRANEMARRDDLTGLHNDRFFHHRLTEVLREADQGGTKVSLLFLDLDNFKAVNDTHGHLAGSQVLKEFGYLLHKTVREEGATLARYGGDEFVIILPGIAAERAMEIAEDIRYELSQTDFLQADFSWADGPIVWRRGLISCSLGVGVYPDHVVNPKSEDHKKNLLLRAADQGMYAAKAAGKDCIVLASLAEVS